MGGHLSPNNKLVFDRWWRHSFTDPGLVQPTQGLIWDYCPNPGTPGFVPCSSTHLALSSSPSPTSKASSAAPFISTTRANAVAHVAHGLISQGHPVLLVGSLGSGKTAFLQQVLSKIASSDVTLQHYYLSQVRITPIQLPYIQHTLLSNITYVFQQLFLSYMRVSNQLTH